MKTALRFFICTSTCVLIGYLGGLALGVDLEKNKAPEKDKGCRVSTPDPETGIKNDCYE